MAILVTGGMGFIGSNFLKIWRESRFEKAVNVDDLSLENITGWQNPLSSTTDFVHSSIGDYDAMTAILHEHKPRAVINFAAQTHVDRSISDPHSFIKSNVSDISVLLEACVHYTKSLSERKDFLFFQISTDEVYGSVPHTQKSCIENSILNPGNPYSASKAASEHLVTSFSNTYGFDYIISRCSNNYGPGQNPEKLIPKVIQNAVNWQDILIYGNGNNIRDWLFVSDHIAALILLLDKGRRNQIYNISGNVEVTNNDLVSILLDKLDEFQPCALGSYSSLIKYTNDRPGHDFRYSINSDKISSELAWSPYYNLEDGLFKCIHFSNSD